MTRSARALLAVALAAAALTGFFLVRTFRSPALETAAASSAEPVNDTGREPVPPEATMPGAPDSGWANISTGGGAGPATMTEAPPVIALAQTAPPGPVPTAPEGNVRSYVPSSRAPARRRTYTDADLRAYVATRGGAVTRDSDYVYALRQRRVDDLRERVANARSPAERAKLQDWLDGAIRDLDRASQ